MQAIKQAIKQACVSLSTLLDPAYLIKLLRLNLLVWLNLKTLIGFECFDMVFWILDTVNPKKDINQYQIPRLTKVTEGKGKKMKRITYVNPFTRVYS
jgi:hypothetical protein